VEREPHRVALAYELHPQPGYPFTLVLRLEYALSAGGLRVSTTATNAGAERCPYGAGAHPYLESGSTTVDAATVHLPARTVLDPNADGTSFARRSVADTPFDFGEGRPIGTTRLDHCFTDLQRDGDGIARVTVRRADGRGVALWVDEAYPYLMLYTGDDRPDVARRSLAVEPMTCPPQAFRTGEGVITLAPGASVRGSWGIAPG
jgi:aldose 1-epimerase